MTRFRDQRLLAALEDGPAGLAARVIALHEDSSLYDEVRRAGWEYAGSLSYKHTTDAFLEALQ